MAPCCYGLRSWFTRTAMAGGSGQTLGGDTGGMGGAECRSQSRLQDAVRRDTEDLDTIGRREAQTLRGDFQSFVHVVRDIVHDTAVIGAGNAHDKFVAVGVADLL